MINPLGNEQMYGFLKTSLDAATIKHQVAAANMANIDTPGYKARSMNFEAVLQDYLDQEAMQPDTRGDERNPLPPPQPLEFKDYITVQESGHLTERFDGNNVQLEKEMADMAHARSRFTLATNFLNRKIRLLQEVIASR